MSSFLDYPDDLFQTRFRRFPRIPADVLIVAALAAAAILIRMIYAIPGLNDPALLMRPDSPGYVNPALAIVRDGTYAAFPGGDPTPYRTPLYPLFLAGCFLISRESLICCILASCILGGLIVVPVYCSVRLFASWRSAICVGILFLLNPTAIAISPMFLSDNLFLAFYALQMMFFLRYVKFIKIRDFCMAMLFAALAVLTRPANLLWILPALFILWVIPRFPMRHKIIGTAVAILIYAALPGSWVLRNHGIGAGYRIDATQTHMLLQNVTTLESQKSLRPEPVIRAEYEEKFDEVFRNDPSKFQTLSSKLDYQDQFLTKKMTEHFGTYLVKSLRPFILAPDVPSFTENIGMSKGGRNTTDIMNRQGVVKAVIHYFDGNFSVLFMLVPLLILTAILYLLSFTELIRQIWKKDILFVLLFLALAEYYLFLPGAIPMPRYHLPAIAFFCVMAGMAIDHAWEKFFSSRVSSTRNRS